ncbi:hypothetical protein Tco_0002304 [Tanacetum coccineum]
MPATSSSRSENNTSCTNWASFGGNTRDLGSFRRETDEDYDLHQDFPRSMVLRAVEDDVAGKERACIYFHFVLRRSSLQLALNVLSNHGSITYMEGSYLLVSLLTFFPPGRTVKLCKDILMFQQHHEESLSEAWTRFKDLL